MSNIETTTSSASSPHKFYMVATPTKGSSSSESKENWLCPEDVSDWFGFELKVKLKGEAEGWWKYFDGTFKRKPVYPVIDIIDFKWKKKMDGSDELDSKGDKVPEIDGDGNPIQEVIGKKFTKSSDFKLEDQVKFQTRAAEEDQKEAKKKTTACNFLLDMTTKLHREVVIQHVQKEEPYLAWLALTQTYEGKTEIERRTHLELIKYKIPQTYKAHKKTTSVVLLSLVSAIGILATNFQLLHITMSDADKKSLFSLSLSKDMSVEMDSVNINSPNISYYDLSQRMISTLQTREFSQSISEVDKVTENIERSATGLQALSKQDISDKDRGNYQGECFYCTLLLNLMHFTSFK